VALVGFVIEPDPRFEREGDDLLAHVAISFAQAALGARVAVPGIDGDETIELAAGTQSGTVVTLRGKGVPRVGARGRGDLHARFQVVVPKSLTAEQRRAVADLAAALEGHPVELPPERESGLGALFGRRRKKK
jgi:molecular chaperone DnaJ